jgi:16S rRNA (cytosine1402-N4)-methyltransferase
MPDSEPLPAPHKRRKRYSGKNPRRFEEKYKELNPELYGGDVAKILASGKTPAGSHRPIMVQEILEALSPKPGELAVDCTLGYAGHAREILACIQPDGKLLGLDADPIELPKTESRLRALGFGPETFTAHRSNFAGLLQLLSSPSSSPLAPLGERVRVRGSDGNETPAVHGADVILADLGLSSMQIDDPTRGFSMKHDGPLDMRLNPQRGQPASKFLEKINPMKLAAILLDNGDESRAPSLAPLLAGKTFPTTLSLTEAIRNALPELQKDALDLTLRRVFQAIRIAVNDEFSALDTFLRNLPACLNPGGRVAILTFHSGEDRRVKKAFAAGLRDKLYAEISPEVIRPTPEERHANPRSSSAKLRWARKTA